ncbi:MAG: FAD-dependent oxidoreductase [Stagnimonas sp.]|nr:FAD-dependent oxidoreductase [Stagnimonas sp.]
MTLNRRDFLKISGAGAAITLTGCATTQSASGPRAHVVVVGAGFGGATCAKYLRTWGPNIDVTLIEPNDKFISCPISNWVIGGLRNMNDITHGYDKLSKYGIKMVKDSVIAIDPGKRTVKTRGGSTIGYDRLVLAPGIDVMTDSIKGYKEAESAGKVTHAWKAGAQTALLRKQLEAMPDGGTFLMAIPGTPYRCPPGPYERISLVANYLSQAKPKSKILVLDSNADIVSKKPLFMDAWTTKYAGMIEYRPANAVQAVDGSKMTASTEFDEIKADVLNVVPRQRSGDLCALAGVRDPNANWCTVNFATFESAHVPNVHVIGDSVQSGLPKSGHMATNMAKVCAAAIVELMAGRQPDAMPVVANTCYSATSGTTSGYVANVYRFDAAKKEYVNQPEGGATPKGDAANFVFNESWAKNIWADVLS